MSRKKAAKGDALDDAALWRAIAETVQPLKKRQKSISQIERELRAEVEAGATASQNVSPQRKNRPRKSVSVPLVPSHVTPQPRLTETIDLHVGRSAGVDRRTADRLKRGKLPIEARLDLHGHSRESAHQALYSFIHAAHSAERRCVLVVTGKGKGILQEAVPRWLNDPSLRPMVLSVQYAQQRDGGTGALYVLLRRRRG